MITIAKLFGKSPFAPLQTHMKRVADCVEKLGEIFDVLPAGDPILIEKLAEELSSLEHQADLTKNGIRNHLPKSLFLPIERPHFLEILSTQDHIADKAEEIGLLLSFKMPETDRDLESQIRVLYQKSRETFRHAKIIIEELDELLESSFGGLEAEKVKTMVERTAYCEHEVTGIQRTILKHLLSGPSDKSPSEFYVWERLIRELGSIAELSEAVANKIRVILELK